MKKTIAIILSIAMCLVLFAGCANETTSTPDNGSEDTNNTESKINNNVGYNETDAASGNSGSAAENESIIHDVINIACASDMGTWNPFNISGIPYNVYQTLGHLIDGVYYPCLMKDNYYYSDDGLTIYCELYDNIYDHAGVHFTASDVVFSYDMANAGNTAGLSQLCNECVATGDYTFEFHLNEQMQVGRWDKFLKFFLVTEESYNNSPDEMATDPIGTGPYKVTNYTSGYSWTFERWDEYWQDDASQICYRDMANVQTINYYVIPESTQRVIALENGQCNMTNQVAAEDLPTFEASEDYWLFTVYDDLCGVLIPNCDESSPMSDVNLRKAIFYAIDNQTILDSVLGGRGTVMHDIAPEWAVGYQDEWTTEENYYNVYDVELAKEYLAQSSYNGEKLVILCMNGEQATTYAQLVMGFLSAIGVDSEMLALEIMVANQYKESADAWDIFLNSSACNTYWIDMANGELSTAKTSWGSSQNFIYDDTLQAMLDKCMQEGNSTPENLKELHDYIIENAYWYSVYNSLNYYVVPSFIDTVGLSNRKDILPGACTYVS